MDTLNVLYPVNKKYVVLTDATNTKRLYPINSSILPFDEYWDNQTTEMEVPDDSWSWAEPTWSGSRQADMSYYITDPSDDISIVSLSAEGKTAEELVLPSGYKISISLLDTSCKKLIIPNDVLYVDFDNWHGTNSIEYIETHWTNNEDSLSTLCHFAGFENLIGVYFGDEVSYISYHICYNCFKLRYIRLPDGLTAINQNAFCHTDLRTFSYHTSESLIIAANAFDSCMSLQNVSISNISSLGNYCFANCTSLEWAIFGGKVSDLDFSAFSGCSKLQHIRLLESLRSCTFNNISTLTSLKEIILPETLEQLTVTDCISVDKTPDILIYIPRYTTVSGVEYLQNLNSSQVIINPNNAIAKNTSFTKGRMSWNTHPKVWIKQTYENDFIIEKGSTNYTATGLTDIGKEKAELVMPDFISSIGYNSSNTSAWATTNCKSFTLSKTFIGFTNDVSPGSLFNNQFPNLSTIDTSLIQGDTFDKSIQGVLINNDTSTFLVCPRNKAISVVPYGVTSIGTYAFYRNNATGTVSLPDGLETIGDYAFQRSNFTTLTIPSGVYPDKDHVGQYAFYGCSQMTINLPRSFGTAIKNNTDLYAYWGLATCKKVNYYS